MMLKKKKGSFNDYDATVSWGQLEIIAAALERDHSDPVADELFAELGWYMERVPGPGEEEEDVKAREEGAAPPQEGDEDLPLPMPPTEGEAPAEPGLPGEAKGGEGEAEGEVTPEDMEAALSGEAPVPEPGLEDEAEAERLPAPPTE